MDQKYEKRDLKVIQWRKEGVTQAEVARRLGITRQRVQQIEQRLDLGARREPGVYKKYPFKCRQCGRKAESKMAGRVFCSRECFFESRKVERSKEDEAKRVEAKKERNRQRSRYYYHNVFKKRDDWQEIVKERNDKYSQK